MKKLGLVSLVLAGVAFTVVGCASEAGLKASGSAQTGTSGVQGGVGVDVGASSQVQPGQVEAGASGSVSGSATAQ